MADLARTYDVLVVGGGNAALCAAITARRAGASVLIVESAPKAFRGGNSRHTRNFRSMHERPTDVLTEAYPEEEYWQDLLKVTGGQTNEQLARHDDPHLGARARRGWSSTACASSPRSAGTLHLSRTNAFFLGGGKALVNAYYRTAEQLGVEIAYDTEARRARHPRRPVPLGDRGERRRAARDRAPRRSSRPPAGSSRTSRGSGTRGGPPADNFLDPRHAVQHGRGAAGCCSTEGAKQIGDPTQCHCGGDRRALAEVRRRHRAPASTACRSASS